MNELPKYHWKNILTVIYVVVFTVLCYISGGYTVRDLLGIFKEEYFNFFYFFLLIIEFFLIFEVKVVR